jgi:hypothetical protein
MRRTSRERHRSVTKTSGIRGATINVPITALLAGYRLVSTPRDAVDRPFEARTAPHNKSFCGMIRLFLDCYEID